MKKRMATVVAAVGLSALCVSTVWAAGWGQDERGYWYQNPTGSYARSGFSTIDGVMYAFDAEGYMITGWQSQDGQWYYFEPESGAQAIGWKQIDGKWYFFDQAKSGVMQTGWRTEGNKTFYLGSDGAMIQNREFCTCDTEASGSGGGYTYVASEDGSIIKNKADEAHQAIYDEYGRLKIKDALSIASGVASGESYYQYIMCEHYDRQSAALQKENVRSGVVEHLEDYAVKYDEDVRDAKYSKRQERYETWKEKLLRGMEKYVDGSVYEEDLRAYIQAVVNGTFENGDEFVETLPERFQLN